RRDESTGRPSTEDETMSNDERFRSVGPGGLDHESRPMKLWHKAKKLGTWDPTDIDFERDAEDWAELDDREREVLLHLTGLFLGGEESVTRDLVPFLTAVGERGPIEAEMFLTSFLFEEAKHVEAFRRFVDEVTGEPGDLSRFFGEAYRRLFDDELPGALERLREERTPETLAEASVTYHMVVEGVTAETGYHAYFETLETHDILPGMREMVTSVQRDESRHLAFGVWFLSDLVDRHGGQLWDVIDRRMSELLPIALQMIDEFFSTYDEMPLGLEFDQFATYAREQFQKRRERIRPDGT
ncbi:MAG: R2-like ligand-binding oxidase, partial [Bradymonadaceae bacterium]